MIEKLYDSKVLELISSFVDININYIATKNTLSYGLTMVDTVENNGPIDTFIKEIHFNGQLCCKGF